MRTITEHLKQGRFIKIGKKCKIPAVSKGEDWNEKTVSIDEANKFLEEGFNVGLVAGQGLIIIDADQKESVEWCDQNLPFTLTETTCSGGRHYFYMTNEVIDNTLIGKDMGEVRCNRQFVVIAPSRAKKKNSNEEGDYTIDRDIAMTVITKEIVSKLLSHFQTIEVSRDTVGLVQENVNKSFLEKEVISKLSPYMKDLVMKVKEKEELNLLGFPSRSERDMKIVSYLLNRGFGKYITSIFKTFGCGDKYLSHSAPDKYLDKTIEEAIKFLGMRTKEDMDLEFNIEDSNVTWLKRHLDEFLLKIHNVKDNTNLFRERLLTTLAFRIKVGQNKLDKRLKELIEINTPKKTLSLSELFKMEFVPQKYWINPILPKGTISMIGSRPGEGKSLFVQTLMTSIITTRKFLSYPCEDLPKIILYSVDDSSEQILHSRSSYIINGLKEDNTFTTQHLDNGTTSFTFNKNNLNKEIEFCLKYDIIILDSYRRLLQGSENESEITDDFFNNFLKPLKEAGKTIIILHHLRKTNMEDIDDTDLIDIFRGSGDVVATLDLAYILQTNQINISPLVEGKDCVLKIVKNRLGIPFRDSKGNYTNQICYRVVKDLTKTSTIFKYLDPVDVKSPKDRRRDSIIMFLKIKGSSIRQKILDEIIAVYHCSQALVIKDLEDMVKSGELVREKFGSYSLVKSNYEESPSQNKLNSVEEIED